MLLRLVFQILKVFLIKICKIEPPNLLSLVAFISFYISRYHFSQILRTSFCIIRKKDFRHKFSFLTDSLKWLKSAKCDKGLLLMLPYCHCMYIFSETSKPWGHWNQKIAQYNIISWYAFVTCAKYSKISFLNIREPIF